MARATSDRSGRPGRTDPTAAPAPARGFADPGGLGLAAFALTTFVLSLANAGLVPTAGAAVLGLALFYGGVVQLIAGLWEFATGNTFGATAFCSYGAFWLAFWYLVSTKGAEAAGSAGVGVFLLAWGIFTLYMTVAALRTTGAILAVFVVLTLTFFALALGELTGTKGLGVLGGYLGILTALLAWYASFATVLNAAAKRVVLPVFPRA
jgi:succinate-acetate transporter protein